MPVIFFITGAQPFGHSPTYNQHHSAEAVVEIQLLPHRVIPAKGLLQATSATCCGLLMVFLGALKLQEW